MQWSGTHADTNEYNVNSSIVPRPSTMLSPTELTIFSSFFPLRSSQWKGFCFFFCFMLDNHTKTPGSPLAINYLQQSWAVFLFVFIRWISIICRWVFSHTHLWRNTLHKNSDSLIVQKRKKWFILRYIYSVHFTTSKIKVLCRKFFIHFSMFCQRWWW